MEPGLMAALTMEFALNSWDPFCTETAICVVYRICYYIFKHKKMLNSMTENAQNNINTYK